jgi:hypothetical protein
MQEVNLSDFACVQAYQIARGDHMHMRVVVQAIAAFMHGSQEAGFPLRPQFLSPVTTGVAANCLFLPGLHSPGLYVGE